MGSRLAAIRDLCVLCQGNLLLLLRGRWLVLWRGCPLGWRRGWCSRGRWVGVLERPERVLDSGFRVGTGRVAWGTRLG